MARATKVRSRRQINAGEEARAEAAETVLAQRRLDKVTKFRASRAPSAGRSAGSLKPTSGPPIVSVEQASVDLKGGGSPHAPAKRRQSCSTKGRPGGLHGAAVLFFRGLFISFGAGLIWR